MPVERRPSPVSIRFNETELEELRSRAGRLPLSSYVKKELFDGDKPRSRRIAGMPNSDLVLLGQILAKLGSSHIVASLAILAEAAKSGSLGDDDVTTGRLREACDDVREMRLHLLRALGLRPGGSS